MERQKIPSYFLNVTKTMVEVALLAGSGNRVSKGNPTHGVDDNLAKPSPFGYVEDND
jgi:hypothetical protein